MIVYCPITIPPTNNHRTSFLLCSEHAHHRHTQSENRDMSEKLESGGFSSTVGFEKSE